MGTYSEIAAAMQRRDYEEMLKSVSQHQHKKELEDFFQEADKLVLGETTSIDSLDVVNGNKEGLHEKEWIYINRVIRRYNYIIIYNICDFR